MVSLLRARDLPLPRFQKGDLLDLADYIRSVGALHGASPCHDLPGRVDMESEKAPIGSVEDEWDFITRVFNKVPLMIKKARVESRAFPRLSPTEMRHIFAFICSSSKNCEPLVE